MDKQSRPQSGTTFPYFDLEQSIKVAEAIYQKGGGHCTSAQLAAWLDYKSTSSGTYLMRYYAAKHFGLIEATRGLISVTDRGKAILAPVMPEDATKARVDAFLSIPLFEAIFQKFDGQTLPPETGMKNLLLHTFRIVSERVTQAYRVLMKSAEQAGFFSISQDRSRMIAPTPAVKSPQSAPAQTEIQRERFTTTFAGSGGPEGPRGVHDAISGLLRDLPTPGTPWPGKKRFKDAFIATIDYLYPEESAS